MIRPYHRDCLVLAMYALHGDWTAARSYSDMKRDQAIEDVEDLLAGGVIPLKHIETFKECLHGERLAQMNERADARNQERAA